MRIIPVLDLKAGAAVHAVAGEREKYQPVRSCLSPSSDPVELARAFQQLLCSDEVYLADLDAIAGLPPSEEVYAGITSLGVKLMLDAGIHNQHSLDGLLTNDVDAFIIGLETVDGPDTLAAIVKKLGKENAIFSLDMKGGHPLGDTSRWRKPDPLEIAQQAISAGVRRMILLDLARVGTGRGTGTEDLCRKLRSDCPDQDLIVGGGIRTMEDLLAAQDAGASGVLVATAIHDGRIGRPEIELL